MTDTTKTDPSAEMLFELRSMTTDELAEIKTSDLLASFVLGLMFEHEDITEKFGNELDARLPPRVRIPPVFDTSDTPEPDPMPRCGQGVEVVISDGEDTTWMPCLREFGHGGLCSRTCDLQIDDETRDEYCVLRPGHAGPCTQGVER